MTFRYARHTSNLDRIEKFYTEIVGLEKLGEFKNHDKYDGIFLGLPDLNWHLEFTVSDQQPTNKFDEDDLLVFYLKSEMEVAEVRSKIEHHNIKIETPKNPYWSKNGLMISDPDGHKIIFSYQALNL